jgi:hypothetical protein
MKPDNSRTGRGLPPRYTLLGAGCLLLALATPLWVSDAAQQPFELPKVVLVRTLAGLPAAAASLLSSPANARRLLAVLGWPAAVPVVLGIAQAFGWQPLPLLAARSSLASALELGPHSAHALALAQKMQMDNVSNGGEP